MFHHVSPSFAHPFLCGEPRPLLGIGSVFSAITRSLNAIFGLLFEEDDLTLAISIRTSEGKKIIFPPDPLTARPDRFPNFLSRLYILILSFTNSRLIAKTVLRTDSCEKGRDLQHEKN